jgi:vitamin K-dependent gamma-carboxylase
MRTLFSRLRAMMFSPVDPSSLVALRIAFGGIMIWEVVCYFLNGWIAEYWIEPAFHFTYPGFDWVKPWPGDGMYVHMAILGVLAAFIAAGWFYRASATLFFLGFTYTFLLERARYLNHFYFVCLISLLMIFVPAHRAFSLDAWFRPQIRASSIPFWSLWILRAQLAIVYFYSGIAKLNSDWIRGEPLRTWLQDLKTTPVVGWLFEHPGTFQVIAWGGMLFDLLIVPLLLWKRTRAAAFVVAVCFHLLNAWFFTIGIFPWFSIAMTTLFLEPDWPRRLGRRLGIGKVQEGSPPRLTTSWPALPRQRFTLTLLSVYMGFQMLFPLRHWLYPGDVAWTEEGHEFSWRMKLRGKIGQTVFLVRNPATEELWLESAEDYLEPWQARKMRTRPDLIRQFAHHLARLYAHEIGAPVKVRVQSFASLNGHPPGALIDPEMDLSDEPYRLTPSKWITPRPQRQSQERPQIASQFKSG